MTQDLERNLRLLLARETSRDALTVGLEEDIQDRLVFDSLGRLELIAAVEQHFDIVIPDQRLQEMRTLGDLLSAVADLKPARAA